MNSLTHSSYATLPTLGESVQAWKGIVARLLQWRRDIHLAEQLAALDHRELADLQWAAARARP